jgi:hypothetical protein
MLIESAADRLEFFDTDDFAVNCALVGPDYTKTIAVIMNAVSEAVTIYDTNIEAPQPHFLCLVEQINDLNRRLVKQFTATIEGVSYQLERISDDQDGLIATVYLKK